MYFVYDGDVLAWYTGDKKKMDLEQLPIPAMHYEYDDETRWTNKKLEEEAAFWGENGEGHDEDISAVIEIEQRRRSGVLSVPEFDRWDVLIDYLERYAGDMYADPRKPLIFPDEISLPVRKLIREVAQIEHEEIAFRKKNLYKTPEEIDEETQEEFLDLDKRGYDAREALLDSDLGDKILDMEDPVEDLKDMAAQMLFFYAQTRSRAETEGGEPEEDFFYAGSNLYAHAVVDQVTEENESDDEDDDSDPEGELDAFFGHLGDYIASGADDDFMKEFDEMTVRFLADKGFDIKTLAGAKAAQKFLEEADLEDAFVTEGPVEDEVDKHMARMRLDSMLACVKARIQKMIEGKK